MVHVESTPDALEGFPNEAAQAPPAVETPPAAPVPAVPQPPAVDRVAMWRDEIVAWFKTLF